MDQAKEYLTVSELNHWIQAVVQNGFPEKVWVCGEIQGFNRNRTKTHIFFELCEKDLETRDVQARIGLVIFAGRKALLQQTLARSGDPFQLKDDIEVKFLCRVDFYPPHGALRLIVEDLDPSYTLGKIAAEKQRLIALLRKDGTLERNAQLPFPELPLRVGLVTSFDSAAYNDFLSELRLSGFGFQIFYENALMQGRAAVDDICRALTSLYDRKDRFDVIVLTRGGGSVSDLSCFDAEPLARTIAESPLPVLTGIGHEIDLSIADLAAHTMQKTPTAAAQYLVDTVRASLERLDDCGRNFFHTSRQALEQKSRALHQSALTLQAGLQGLLKEHRQDLTRLETFFEREPQRLLRQMSLDLGHRRQRFLDQLGSAFKHEQNRLDHLRRIIELSDPQQMLKKGFTLTRAEDGRLIRSAGQVKSQEVLITEFFDGTVRSHVDSFNDDKGDPVCRK